MPVVCLCGSTRHERSIVAAQEEETLRGNIVLAPVIFAKAEGRHLSDEEVELLRELHRQKIDLADEILVVAPDGRIGESTAAEIAYGQSLGMPVRYWEPSRDSGAIEPMEVVREGHLAQQLVTNDMPAIDVSAAVGRLTERALETRARFAAYELRTVGHEWGPSELMAGFSVDVGDLTRLVMAAQGHRSTGTSSRMS